MHCTKCKFQVDQNMKFALMKNICPACGSQLFSDNEMSDISLLRNRLGKEQFSVNFTEELAFDIALFIMNEIKNGIGQKYLQQMMIKSESPISEEEVSRDNSTYEEDIRRQVQNEIEGEFPEFQSMPDDQISSRTRAESADEKSKRLREVARKSGIGNKQGTVVRRVN